MPPPGHEPASVVLGFGASAFAGAAARGGGGAEVVFDGGGVGGRDDAVVGADGGAACGGSTGARWARCTIDDAQPDGAAGSAGAGLVVCAGVQGCCACLDELATGGDWASGIAVNAADEGVGFVARRFFWYKPGRCGGSLRACLWS